MRVDPATLTKIVDRHTDAAEEIDSSAKGAPQGDADFGPGAAHVLEILRGVSETAGELSLINQAVAFQVAAARDDVTATESGVADNFSRMQQRLGGSPQGPGEAR